jgi:hypothetical protein
MRIWADDDMNWRVGKKVGSILGLGSRHGYRKAGAGKQQRGEHDKDAKTLLHGLINSPWVSSGAAKHDKHAVSYAC